MPCSIDLNINLPTGPSTPTIPGIGNPFAIQLPNINLLPDGFPEDLNDLFNKIQFLIPPGALKANLKPNFSKDIYDAISSVIEQFFPFLMLYRFFLPLLNIIVCIIEVACAIPNPFKVRRALKRLFRKCLPDFLALFPVFALIAMLISLLLLILALIEYIIDQIRKLVEQILRNIKLLQKVFIENNKNAVIAATKKFGALLCVFQNLFVLLSVFNLILQVIKDILKTAFSIGPCRDGDDADVDGCCTPDVCPDFIKQNFTRVTGDFKYLNRVAFQSSLSIPGFNNIEYDLRSESRQLFDGYQQIVEQFSNMYDAYDVTTVSPKPVFFPTDVVYTAKTAPRQAAYTVDVKMFYNPATFNRIGPARNILFKDCIVLKEASPLLAEFDNSATQIPTGVLTIAGGLGYEENGNILLGYDSLNINTINQQATLENFIYLPAKVSTTPEFYQFDGYTFHNVEYTFKPNIEVLINKQLVTAGCDPSFAIDRAFINEVIAADANFKFIQLSSLVNNDGSSNSNDGNGGDGNFNTDNATFPNLQNTIDCLNVALGNLRSNISVEGVADFQAFTTVCLEKLKKDTETGLFGLIDLGFDASKSNFTIEPEIQFTTDKIKVTVNLLDKNGQSLTNNLPESISSAIALKLKAHTNFATIDKFTYADNVFYTFLTSKEAGSGSVQISYDNTYISIDNIPDNIEEPPQRIIKSLDYQFIFANGGFTDGVRRDISDILGSGSKNN